MYLHTTRAPPPVLYEPVYANIPVAGFIMDLSRAPGTRNETFGLQISHMLDIIYQG